MKKNFHIISILLVCNYTLGFSQVGIGTTLPKSSAALDINVDNLPNGSKKGVLLPKINLLGRTDNATIPAPATGLWIFNTNTENTLDNKVYENSMYFRQPTKWEKYSSLPEIISLKQISEYVLSTITQQNFTSDQINTINTNSQEVALTWDSKDVIVDNPNHMKLDINNSTFSILKEGYYQFTGMINVAPKSTNGTNPSSGFVLISLQKSVNGGAWTTFGGSGLPYEYGVTDLVQTVTIPVIIEKLSSTTKIRFVISNPQLGTTNYGATAGIVSNNDTDITKTIRVSKIRTSAYED